MSQRKTPGPVRKKLDPVVDIWIEAWKSQPDATQAFEDAAAIARFGRRLLPTNSELRQRSMSAALEALIESAAALMRDERFAEVIGWDGAMANLLTSLRLRVNGIEPTPEAIEQYGEPMHVQRLWPGMQTSMHRIGDTYAVGLGPTEERRALEPYLKWLEAQQSGRETHWAGRNAGRDWDEAETKRRLEALWNTPGVRRKRYTQDALARQLGIVQSTFSVYLTDAHLNWIAVRNWFEGRGPRPW
jgi:hypothetical protein